MPRSPGGHKRGYLCREAGPLSRVLAVKNVSPLWVEGEPDREGIGWDGTAWASRITFPLWFDGAGFFLR